MRAASRAGHTLALVPRVAFWLACFSSIATLLGHTGAVCPMARLALALWLPGTGVMMGLWLVARRAGDADFLLRVHAGLLGGLWGTLGYDIVRMPFHHLGMNPLTPIRAYGIWLCAAGHSSPATDLVGLAYNFSNGLTFGMIFSLVMLRRHWAWALLWGVLLELQAVHSSFGLVFAIRGAPAALALAYGAHLFFGYPLGVVCRHPEEWLASALPLHRTRAGLFTIALIAMQAWWFLHAWQPLPPPALGRAIIQMGPDAIYPGWSDAPLGSRISIQSVLPGWTTVVARDPAHPNAPGRSMRVAENVPVMLELSQTGVYQLFVPDRPWRSIFIAVQRDGDYRPVVPEARRGPPRALTP